MELEAVKNIYLINEEAGYFSFFERELLNY